MRSRLILLAMLYGGSALADTTTSVAAPATTNDALQSVPMAGPYATLSDLCRAEHVDSAICEAAPRDCGGGGRRAAHLEPPFLEARIIQWPNACDFAVRTEAGWWQRPADWATSFLHNGERYLSELDRFDSTGDGALVVRGSFIHWTCPEKMTSLEHPRFAEWYECDERVVVCAIGASGVPSCSAPVESGYVTYCRDAEPPHRALRAPLAGVDFRSTAHVTRSEIRMTGARHPSRHKLHFP